MTAPSENIDARVDAAMEMLLRFCTTRPTGFLDRVPWGMRFYVEMFLAVGKLGRLQEPAALVQNCISMARNRAAFYGDTPPGLDLLALAELFERHREEAAAYARDWEAEIIRKLGGAP